MKPGFWADMWRKNRIGFHQHEINGRLRQFFSTLPIAEGTPVFVPLCGKSLDMLWLREQGYPVLGAELSSIAVQAFFAEAGLEPIVTDRPPFRQWSAPGIDILCGDVFDLTGEHLAGVGAFYDRAALVALPPEMRPDYARHLGEILPAGAVGLLVTAEYEQSEMNGPPFSVRGEEVQAIFSEAFTVETLVRENILEQTRFRERLSALSEAVYLLRRKASGTGAEGKP